jgi:hypothetical protein
MFEALSTIQTFTHAPGVKPRRRFVNKGKHEL